MNQEKSYDKIMENLSGIKMEHMGIAEKNKSLKAIMQMFQAASEAIGANIFIFDCEHQTVWFTDSIAKQWGLLSEQPGVPYGLASGDIVTEESKEEFIRIHEAMIHGASKANGKVILKDVNGHIGHYELTFQALLNDNGSPTGKAVGIYRNITEYQENYLHQFEMTKALSEGIASAYYIDFDHDTFIIENLSKDLRTVVTNFVKQQQRCFSEAITAYCRLFVHEDDLSRMLYELKTSTILSRLSEKHSYYIQYKVKKNEDHQKYFEIHITEAGRTNKGHKAFMSFRCIDEQKGKELEQQKTVENALESTRIYAKRAQENLNIINDIIGSGLWYMEFDESGNMDRCVWSDAFRKMLGFRDAHDFPDRLESWSGRLHPEDHDKIMETFWNCIAGKGDYDVQYRLLKKDQKYTWYRTVGKVVRYTNGKPRLFAGTFVDITEDREKERLQSIIASIMSIYFASWVINIKEDSITELSVPEEAYSIAHNPHFSASEAMHILVDNYITSEADQDKMRKFLDVATVSERLGSQNTITAEYRGKAHGWSSANIITVGKDALGNVTEYVLALRGIDQEKKSELKIKQALEDAYEAANRANAAKSDFLSNMSHDIRTPMNAIIGMTAIACAHIDDRERVQDCLSKITVSSKHLLGIINEVLDMSKIESGKLDLNMEDFDLAELVDNLIAMSRPQIEAMHHELIVDIKDIEHEFVTGDSQRIQQSFMNLMSNAIKYTPEGGKIRLSITEKPTNKAKVGCYEFIFEDNGIGMSEEFQKHLFEPFSRAADSRVAVQQGTGLGMSITRNIVSMMNGDIDVESELGRGTKFTVTIFLSLQDVNADKMESDFIDLPVLVVDDDRITCESTCDMLHELGMSGEWVLSGEEAVERVLSRHERQDDYFAIIIDWKMPGMDGVSTTRAIRKAVGDEVPIIIISGYDWSDIELEARAARANAFISKPMFKSRMVHTFKSLMNENADTGALNGNVNKIIQQDFSGRRVLLVEDNELNAEIAGEILGMANITVEYAKDGREALKKMENAADGYYDMVFMDIQMPVMNGYEATRAIRAINRSYLKRVPIIAMTANAFAEDVEAARDVGMNQHIAKPIDFDHLLLVLNTWLV